MQNTDHTHILIKKLITFEALMFQLFNWLFNKAEFKIDFH